MKPSSTNMSIQNIAQAVRTAQERSNRLLLNDRKQPEGIRMDALASLQQMRAILVAELHSLDTYPDDAYELLYRYSTENNDETTYMEELFFLEYCIR